jgi:hypothetical protein
MAGRVLSRRALRDQHDQSEESDQETDEGDESPAAEPKARKPRARKAAGAGSWTFCSGRGESGGYCVRKLVMICYGVFKNRRPFDPDGASRITP